jgi:hypothetical protein
MVHPEIAKRIGKTLTQLCEEYEDWCGKNDIDSYLKSRGFSVERRMISADELQAELLSSREDAIDQIKVLDNRLAWVGKFIVDWREAERAEKSLRRFKETDKYAVFAHHTGFGWTNVHVFDCQGDAINYVNGQLDDNPNIMDLKDHEPYTNGDVVFTISPVVEG